MSKKVEELKLDIKEFNDLLQQATRQRTKDALSLELRRLETEMDKLSNEIVVSTTKPENAVPNAPQKSYEVKLNNYGWDQTNTAMKLYITLKDVHQLPKEAITCNFTTKSLDLRILGLGNKNYHLPINNLCEEIDPEKSNTKVKTDMVLVTLAKKVPNQWSHVTGVEKKIKESKMSSVTDIGEDSDPSASMMNIIKKMYDEGDDQMKKTIAKTVSKAWSNM